MVAIGTGGSLSSGRAQRGPVWTKKENRLWVPAAAGMTNNGRARYAGGTRHAGEYIGALRESRRGRRYHDRQPAGQCAVARRARGHCRECRARQRRPCDPRDGIDRRGPELYRRRRHPPVRHHRPPPVDGRRPHQVARCGQQAGGRGDPRLCLGRRLRIGARLELAHRRAERQNRPARSADRHHCRGAAGPSACRG